MTSPLVLTSTVRSRVATTPNTGPRVDFLELARGLHGDLTFPDEGGGLLSLIEEKTASHWRQAWAARRSKTHLYLSLSEKIGLPLALLDCGRRRHVLIAHHLTSPRKKAFQRRTRYLNRFDRIIVACSTQERYLVHEARVPAERVHIVPVGVDHLFFSQDNPGRRVDALPAEAAQPGYILSVGREKRDYDLLMDAVGPLGVPTVVVASSPWSRAGDRLGRQVPPNVRFLKGISYDALRELYAHAGVVCLPLEPDVEYAAGVNGLLEAMSMKKGVILTATPGITDYVEDGVNARVVVPRDPKALGSAISSLLQSPAQASEMGRVAREDVDRAMNLDMYLRHVLQIVNEVSCS